MDLRRYPRIEFRLAELPQKNRLDINLYDIDKTRFKISEDKKALNVVINGDGL